MRARVIHNKVICGTQYLGFVLETDERVGFSYSPTHGAYNLSKPSGSSATLTDEQRLLLKKIRETISIPDETPTHLDLFLAHNNFAGQVIDIPEELLK